MQEAGVSEIIPGEEDYADTMLHKVRPLLEKHRTDGYFQSPDGTKIYYQFFRSPQEKAAVVISHGFCEFTSKFEEVIFRFFQAGYSVYIMDHRGHGYSQRSVKDGCEVYVRSYDEYVLDLHTFITEIVEKNSPDSKRILYAHSMGGAIAALYLERHPDVFQCAVLSSPMLELGFGKLPRSLIWLVTLFKKLTRTEEHYVVGQGAFDGIPHFKASGCLSEARYNFIFSKREEDEHYRTYGASYAWALASLRAVQQLQKHAELVRTPVLLFQAGKDTTVKPGGQLRFAKKSKNTQLIVIPGSRHEIYNADTETQKDYYRRIFEFLDQKL